LREIGFDLETIGRLLDRQQDPGEAVRMQLDALEAQRRALERRRLVLKAAMGTDPSRQALLARLQRKQTLAGLDKLEREAFLAAHLGWSADDPPASQAVWRAAIFDLPEQMNEAQLEAWLELAELASDASFRAALDRQRQPPAGVDPSALLEWEQQSRRIYSDLIAAANDHRRDDEVRALLDTWIEGLARLHSRVPDAGFLHEVLERYESADDPRMTRYWELICRIKEMPSQAPVHARVMEWLLARVRARLASTKDDQTMFVTKK
jgi:hypothetical protein